MCSAEDKTPPAYLDPALPVEQRVNDLMGRLTTEEKLGLVRMDSHAVPRLGIPAYHWWNEGLHGIARNGVATVFPQAIGLAATWNTALMQSVGDVVSTEARTKFSEATKAQGGRSRIYQGLTIWSPNINIFRDPRWGRGQETYGEDPFLTANLGTGFVKGLQGADPRYLKTVATLKHFAVHSGPEALRRGYDVRPSPRDLHETYLSAFEFCVREANPQSVMSAYNAIDGVPMPANHRFLDEILRKTWGFEGAVVGDVDTVADIWRAHNYSKDAAEGSALAIRAGNDLCSGRGYDALPESLQRGLVTEAEVDTCVARLLRLRFKLGLFDPADRCAYNRINACDTPAHSRLALEAARQSIVLLKNNGVLPWKSADIKTLAVLGPTAAKYSSLVGNYEGNPSAPITLLDGLRAALEPRGVRVLHEEATPLVAGFEPEAPFPKGELFTDATRTTPGLSLEVFDNPELAGSPLSIKADEVLRRDWSDYTLAADVPEKNASLRWSGVFVPKTTGTVRLVVRSNSLFRFTIGTQIMHDAWSADAKKGHFPLSAEFKAGEVYPVLLEYSQDKSATGSIGLALQAALPVDAYERALAAAREADHILLTLGIAPDIEGESMPVKYPGFDGGDRTSIQLPKEQAQLLADVAALGKPVVVVLTTGSAISLDTDKCSALLCAWYYGQNGGTALAEILLGQVSPSGRLPVTFYAKDSDLPDFNSYAMDGRTYRYFGGKPLFAFGHGLSYVNFRYEQPALSDAVIKSDGRVTVSVRVKNDGAMQAGEVVQVYARELSPREGKPLRQLVGFQRVSIASGQSADVQILVDAARLRHWDESAKAFVVEACDYALDVGPASDQVAGSLKLTVAR